MWMQLRTFGADDQFFGKIQKQKTKLMKNKTNCNHKSAKIVNVCRIFLLLYGVCVCVCIFLNSCYFACLRSFPSFELFFSLVCQCAKWVSFDRKKNTIHNDDIKCQSITLQHVRSQRRTNVGKKLSHLHFSKIQQMELALLGFVPFMMEIRCKFIPFFNSNANISRFFLYSRHKNNSLEFA